MKNQLKEYWVPILICLVYFLTMILTLSDYGLHEDSPFHFLRGQAYFRLLTSGKSTYDFITLPSPVLFIPGQLISLYKPNASESLNASLRPAGTLNPGGPTIQEIQSLRPQFGPKSSFYKHNAWNADYWSQPDQESHPAVSDIAMAAFNNIFYEKLGIAGDIEAYYLYIIVVTTLGLFFLYIFTEKIAGTMAAVLAALTLAFFPFFFAESHFNIKDPVQMSFFTIAIIAFYFCLREKLSVRWFLVFILAVFMALGTKWNIAFMPLIVLPWFFILLRQKSIRDGVLGRKFVIYLFLAISLPFVLLIIAWPYLWPDPIGRLFMTFSFYQGVTAKPYNLDVPSPAVLPLGFDATAILRAITMSPPVTLVFFAVGIWALIKSRGKTNHHEGLLLGLWLLIPIIRSSRADIDIAGSIRNFMEYLAPLAVIAGIGGAYLIKRLFKLDKLVKFAKYAIIVTGALSLGYLAILLSIIIRYHPNENLYFNFLAGGTKGAEKSQYLYTWQSSYENVYRQGINWFDSQAPKDAKLAYLDGTMLAIPPIWLRNDIRFGSYFSGYEQKGEFVISLVYPNAPPVFAYNYLNRFLTPIYELKVDGLTVLKIWQNDKKYIKPQKNLVPIYSPVTFKRYDLDGRKVWDINLDKRRSIGKLILTVPSANCQNSRGVWETVVNGQEHFQSLNDEHLSEEERVIDFPGEEAEIVRFWDVEGNSCIYQAQSAQIYEVK